MPCTDFNIDGMELGRWKLEMDPSYLIDPEDLEDPNETLWQWVLDGLVLSIRGDGKMTLYTRGDGPYDPEQMRIAEKFVEKARAMTEMESDFRREHPEAKRRYDKKLFRGPGGQVDEER